MNPNKRTKSFFHSKKSLYCPECIEYGHSLIRDIFIYGNVGFSENYMMSLEWHYDKNTHTFVLDETHGNKSPDDHPVLNKISHSISSIQDLSNICSQLNNLGYQITETRLSQECATKYNWTTSCFRHMIDLAWFGDTKTFLLEEEYVKFHEYSLNYDYTKDISTITTLNEPRFQAYTFDYILNIDLKKYSSLKNKIQQTLLLG